MTSKKKKTILGIILAIVVLLISFVGIMLLRMKKQLDKIDKTPVDVSQVADGVYEGEYEAVLVKVKVQVTVSNGEIADVELLKHDNGRGKPAEAMIEEMEKNNTAEVDAVSGATVSSEVIKAAVRDALRKGL
ncbi:MAG: FMN-binding protein [Clostridiales bacterium]|nr:FMN-binding protein [Clostridiales bacterium]